MDQPTSYFIKNDESNHQGRIVSHYDEWLGLADIRIEGSMHSKIPAVYHCSDCNKDFCSQSSVNQHRKRNHSDITTGVCHLYFLLSYRAQPAPETKQ
ncbi:hypothetical protein BV898_04273 [Hypsibius exemplaris]|uniref:C2H2-type domain-containing protein n=1 Tax=Hypsibius exemplaris TaxID=2072580 RepID=A0A1W0X2W8_HYPEX|nr:hypothetical protein BV898_04273 [Hypsibius exemplaris]